MSLSILIVDDSRSVRRIVKKELQTLFQNKEYTIEERANGVDALQACKDGAYDLMFLDLTMPGITGYEVLARMKQEEIRTKVIVLSADIQPEAQTKVKELGAIAFLSKPYEQKTVEQVLREYHFL